MNSNHEVCVQFDLDKLLEIAKRKFIDGVSTVELLQETTTDREKDEVMLVSMIDIDDEELLKLARECDMGSRCAVLTCAEHYKAKIVLEINKIKTRRGQ